jgi:hypothetical protein
VKKAEVEVSSRVLKVGLRMAGDLPEFGAPDASESLARRPADYYIYLVRLWTPATPVTQ